MFDVSTVYSNQPNMGQATKLTNCVKYIFFMMIFWTSTSIYNLATSLTYKQRYLTFHLESSITFERPPFLLLCVSTKRVLHNQVCIISFFCLLACSICILVFSYCGRNKYAKCVMFCCDFFSLSRIRSGTKNIVIVK